MKKKIVSFITILCLVVTLIPATVATSHAATTPSSVSKSTVLERIEELEDGLSGKFFTTDGYRANNSGDSRCNVVNVLNQNSTVRNLIYKNKGKTGYRPSYDSYLPGHYAHDYGCVSTLGYSCFGFANFAEWYIFSSKCSDSVSTKTIAKGIAYNYSNISANAKPGDIVRLTGNGFSGHSGIVKSIGSNYMTILDANGDGGEYYGASRITTRNVYYASGMKVSISRATNSVDGWPALNASNVESTGKIKLSWYKKKNAAKYFVYRASSKNGTYKLIKKTTSTTYTDTAASASYNYYYKVKAVSSAGKFMAWSDVVNRTCDLARPKITSAVKVASSSKIKITWNDVKNANRYELYRGTGDGNYTKIATFDTKMNTGKSHYCYNSKNMTPGKKYYYKIKAINTNSSGADSALSLAVSCVAGTASTNNTNTGNTSTTASASAMVAAAEACVGKSKSSLGMPEEWCAAFVDYCAVKSGNTSKVGDDPYVGPLAKQTVNSEGGTIIFVNKNAYDACKDRFISARCKYDPDYIPKKGDLYIQKGPGYLDPYFAHIGIVRKDSTTSSIAYTIEGNTDCPDGAHADFQYVEYKTRNKNTLSEPYGFSAFVKPAYSGAAADWAMLTATNVENSGKIKLNWEKKSGAAKYFIYRSRANQDNYTLIKKTTITTYIDTAVSASYMYKYKVKAVSGAGKFMAWSDEVKKTCKLAQPSIVYIDNVASTGNIKLKWKDVKNANRYEIYRGIGDGVYTKIATFDTKMNTGKTYACINSKNVTPGVQYYYKVKAINTNNTGADSALSKAWSRVADLAQPTITSVTKGNKKITVEWTAVENADKYQVYRKVKGGSYKLIYTTTGTTCENVKNLSKNKTYYYKVRALDNESANATSAFSSVVSKTYK